jgi:hypothetical protein
MPYLLSADRIYSPTGSTWWLNISAVIPLRLQITNVRVMGKKDPYCTCTTSSTVTSVNRAIISKITRQSSL